MSKKCNCKDCYDFEKILEEQKAECAKTYKKTSGEDYNDWVHISILQSKLIDPEKFRKKEGKSE